MKRKGFTLIELLVVIAIIALLMSILMPALARVRELAQRVVCGTNASGIVKSMIVYANDDDSGQFPRAGLPGGTWGATSAFGAIAVGDAFTSGTATISASLYLCVKHDFTTPKQFLCKSDVTAKVFGDPALMDIWDFGGTPGKHVSYSYHLPYAFGTNPPQQFGLQASSEPGMAVVADRNPYGAVGDNCIAHQGDGQNVAYVDTHVKFEPAPSVGLNGDNIYTIGDIQFIDQGSPVTYPPTGAQGPFTRRDSLLVSEQ
jgi:prepilin-type N-terminal cleavage/methylation domain-containing protein